MYHTPDSVSCFLQADVLVKIVVRRLQIWLIPFIILFSIFHPLKQSEDQVSWLN